MTSLSNVKQKRLYVDPRTTCLPPLNETIPTSGKRTVLACPTLKKAPFGICLCGAHDIMGRGSDVQELPHLDPFSMIHFVESQHRLKPPFCAHPHLGAEVCSIMLRGEEIVPWDNKNGNEKTKLLPGGVYYVSTGSGVVHDETQHLPFSTRKLSQSAFEHGQNGNVPCQDGELLTQFFQVWWNGGIIYNETLPKCTTQIKQPSEIPLVLLEGGLAVRVLVGQLPLQQSTETATDNTETEGETKTKTKTKTEKATDTTTTENLQSPIDLMDMTPMLIMHCRIDPEGDTTIFLPPTMNGAAFVTGKGAQVVFDQIYCCQPDVSSQMALLPPGGKELRIRNPSKTMASEFMIFLGEPVRKPYCKYVGYGGAMVHSSPELCEAAMSSYESDPQNFGRDASCAPIDFTKRFKMIKGFYNKNGTGLEREDNIMARWDEADDFVI